MNAAAIQRFAILLTLVGGILHIEGVIQSNFYGLPSYGMPLISLSVLLGIAGVTIEFIPESNSE